MIVNNTNFLTTMFVMPEDTKIDKDSIQQAIAFNEARAPIYRNLYYYYRGYQDIFDRKKRSGLKNNKLMVNHAEYIVDVNTGYLLGDAVEYQVNCKDEGKEYDIEPIVDEFKKQTIWTTDHTLCLNNGIYGKSYEYTFVKKGLNELMSIPITPTNAIIVYDDTMEHKPIFAVLYSLSGKFPDTVAAQNSFTGFQNITVVTAEDIQVWAKDGVILDDINVIKTTHDFGELPVIEHKNNYFSRGDFFSIISLIDAYNILMSDRVNDKEQLVEAALILKNLTMTPEQLEDFKINKTLSIGKDGDVSYLVKQYNETEIDVLRKAISEDIHKISKTPNLSDQNFVGNSSGVAIKYKLLAFEQSIKNKESYFEKALKQRFRLYNTYFNKLKKMDCIIPLEEVDVIFKKALPQNDVETSTMIANLLGTVTKETLISQLSFVQDASEEIEAVKEEQLNDANAQDPNFGSDNPSIQKQPDMQGQDQMNNTDNKDSIGKQVVDKVNSMMK